MDSIDAILFAGGLILLIISWVLLLVATAKRDFAWALCTLLLPPLSYLVALFRWNDVGKEPVLLAIGGVILVLLGI
ncbi:MAG: hypothetical protein RBS88_00610 [Spongiibacteraceae bacterium]|jgi:hypothetical protein|nr:hypothetical protein [Spongiibacteraceae bacterium]